MIKPPTSGTDLSGLYLRWFGGVTSGLIVVNATGEYSSVNTPGWSSLPNWQKKRSVPWHPFRYVREVWTSIPGEIGYRNVFGGSFINFGHHGQTVGYQYAVFGTFGSSWPHPTLDSARKALSKVQVRIARNSVNLTQAFAERRQTVGLVANSTMRLVQAARQIRRGRLLYAAETLGVNLRKGLKPFVRESRHNLANYWLEFQYGWRPLLSDITGSLDKLAEDSVARARRQEFTAQATDRLINQRFIAARREGGELGSGYLSDLICDQSVVEVSRVVLEAEEDNAFLQSMSATGITNPALLAWELLPYSFVVDWFLPVGNYLQQMEYARGMSFVRGTISTRRTVYAHCGWGGTYTNFSGDWATVSYSQCTGGFTVEKTEKTRTLLTEWPYQSFPELKPKLGVERALSAISLLSQVFDRKRTVR